MSDSAYRLVVESADKIRLIFSNECTRDTLSAKEFCILDSVFHLLNLLESYGNI